MYVFPYAYIHAQKLSGRKLKFINSVARMQKRQVRVVEEVRETTTAFHFTFFHAVRFFLNTNTSIIV